MNEAQEAPQTGNLFLQVTAMLHVVARRKKLITVVCLVTALLSAAYSMTLPVVYTSTVKVLPPQREGGNLSSMLGQMGGLAALAGAGKGGGSESELYIGILKSRTVGEAVIQRLDLAKVYGVPSLRKAWSVLDKSVKATAGKEGIIAISAEAPDPKLAAQIANTVADELGRTMVRLNLTKAGSEKLFLEKRLEVVKKDLKNAEEELKAFSQQTKIVRLESQAGATVSGVVRLKAEIAQKEVQLAVLRNSQTDESHEVQSLLAAIRKLRDELAASAGRGGGTGEGVPSMGSVPGVGLEYARKMRDLKVQEAIFEQLSKQYEVAKINYAKDSSTLQILDDAIPPELRSRPRRAVIVLMSTLVAFLGSVLLVLGQDYLERMPPEERGVFDALIKQALSFK